MSCDLCSNFCLALFFYGLFKTLSFFSYVAKHVHTFYFRKELDLAERYGRGSWALITGANAGIGYEFCIQLAKRGFNIILLSRSSANLAAAVATLQPQFPNTKFHTIAVDYSESSLGPARFQEIAASLQEKGFDVSLLVNNAGFSAQGEFLDIDPEDIRKTLATNVGPHVLLTHALLPAMRQRARATGKRSGIIIVASV